jgi:hypothetical protein
MQELGLLKPHDTVACTFSLFAAVPGIHHLTGFVLTDAGTHVAQDVDSGTDSFSVSMCISLDLMVLQVWMSLWMRMAVRDTRWWIWRRPLLPLADTRDRHCETNLHR